MFTHVKTLIRGINDHGIIHKPFFFQIGDQTPYLIVNRFDATYVILDITLIFPFNQILTFQVLVNEFFVTRLIRSDPSLPLFRGHTIQRGLPTTNIPFLFISLLIFKLIYLQIINQSHIFVYTHLLCTCGIATSSIIIIESIWIWELYILI